MSKASLVYAGEGIHVPFSMGTPRANQLQGTDFEKLGELASRICYDSLGSGRSSADLHKHILEVINLSVYEHLVFTLSINHTGESQMLDFIQASINRKGVWVEWDDDTFEITANYRAILEWEQKTNSFQKSTSGAFKLGGLLRYFAHHLAPQIVPSYPLPYGFGASNVSLVANDQLNEDQRHVSIWLYGSRGFTHEQVRHRFAMSQRSTRYVDESESEYVMHPLIRAFLDDKKQSGTQQMSLESLIRNSKSYDADTYNFAVEYLTEYCKELGINGTNARKQARGAARGYLGNALASEMIFTAPISGWKGILAQRLCAAADAEIRSVYADVLTVLKSCTNCFDDYRFIPSPDGIGVTYERVSQGN